MLISRYKALFRLFFVAILNCESASKLRGIPLFHFLLKIYATANIPAITITASNPGGVGVGVGGNVVAVDVIVGVGLREGLGEGVTGVGVVCMGVGVGVIIGVDDGEAVGGCGFFSSVL